MRVKGSHQIVNQERKRHINLLSKIPGHRPGVPGTPGGTTRVFQGFPVVCPRRTGIFTGMLAGCPRDTRLPRGVSRDFICDFSFVPFRAGPKGVSTKGVPMKRSKIPNFRAFYTVVSKRSFQESP